MRKKRILGQETEYGKIIKQLPRDLEMLEIAKRLYYRFIPLCLRGEAAAREMSWKTDYFLANGGRFYYDAGDHPEYATPECLSARQLVCCSEAGDRLLEELQAEANKELAALGLPSRIYLYRNNHDGKRDTYGCHENYAVKPEIFNSLAACRRDYFCINKSAKATRAPPIARSLLPEVLQADDLPLRNNKRADGRSNIRGWRLPDDPPRHNKIFRRLPKNN